MRKVTRKEFIAHLTQLIAKETKEPCLIETPYPVYSRASGEHYGDGTISYFIERGCVLCNDSLRGMKVSVLALDSAMLVLDEEDEIATHKGVQLSYIIGAKADPYALEVRGDA